MSSSHPDFFCTLALILFKRDMGYVICVSCGKETEESDFFGNKKEKCSWCNELFKVKKGKIENLEKKDMEAKFLTLIEEFKAPRPPSEPEPQAFGIPLDLWANIRNMLNVDTYDHRITSGSPVPPSLTDTLICDIWQLIYEEIDGLTESNIKIEDVKIAFNKYLTLSVDDIPGYRPNAHSSFIKQFKEDELEILANEVVQYIYLNGVRDVKEENDK